MDADTLIQRARGGDASAVQDLLAQYRPRLRRMVAIHMDPRVAARFDPSDVVQDALAEASQKLADYLEDPPLPFYPWLRRLAWERLVQLHRQHIRAKKRSVTREQVWAMPLPDESVARLASRVAGHGASPSARLLRREMLDRIRVAVGQLAPKDREILVLRYLEGLSTAQTAAVLGITVAAVKTRHFRAVQRLHQRLGG